MTTSNTSVALHSFKSRPTFFFKALFCLLLVVGLAAVPWVFGYSTQRLLVEVFTLFTISLAWNALAGYAGIVAVGQHVFVGIGAYALFYISTRFGINPWLILPLSIVVTGIFAAVFAYPMFRLQGAYFAVGTWVLAEMMRILVQNSEWLGAGGGIPLSTMMGISRWLRNAGVYWAGLAVAVTSLFIIWMLLRGRIGLALLSVRDNEEAASACGVNVIRTKFTLWIIAAMMTGAGAAVTYMSTLQVTPDASFGLNWTAAAIFIAVLGGIGSLEGPIIGVIVYFLLREMFSGFGNWYFVGMGILAILIMIFSPEGIWGYIKKYFDPDLFGLRRTLHK